MGQRFGHRQVSLKPKERLGDLCFRDLEDRAGAVADHGVDGVEPALFVPRYRVDTAPTVGECAAVSGHHQRRVAFGDQLEGREVAAQGIPVESALERHRRGDSGQKVIPGEEEPVGLRPQADVAE